VIEYESKYGNKIKVIKSDKPTGSAKDNFLVCLDMLQAITWWHVIKMMYGYQIKSRFPITKWKKQNKEINDIPILVHTDLKVVDENLNLISESLLKMQNLNISRDKINNLLVQNIVTGCTVMVNKKLLSYINIIPAHAVMHDWWLALIASALGEIIFINTPTVFIDNIKKMMLVLKM